MLNIAIVDDSQRDAEKLQRIAGKWFSENHGGTEIKIFNDGSEILKNFEAGKFNIVFMDIIMNTITGIETAECLRRTDSKILIVFVTSSKEFALDAFPVHPFDYVLKPYDPERINYVLSEAVKILERPEPYINVKNSRNSYKIPLKNIYAVISQKHSTNIIMQGSILCPMAFGEIKKELENAGNFLEINRGVIINMDLVMSLGMDKKSFIMKDGSNYAINVRRHKSIIETFTQYQISRLRAME